MKKKKKQWFGQSFVSTELGHPIYAWFVCGFRGSLKKKKKKVIKSAWTVCCTWDAWNCGAQPVRDIVVWVGEWVWVSKRLKKKKYTHCMWNMRHLNFLFHRSRIFIWAFELLPTFIGLKKNCYQHLLFLTSNCKFFY